MAAKRKDEATAPAPDPGRSGLDLAREALAEATKARMHAEDAEVEAARDLDLLEGGSQHVAAVQASRSPAATPAPSRVVAPIDAARRGHGLRQGHGLRLGLGRTRGRHAPPASGGK